jgi:hypothetical protein
LARCQQMLSPTLHWAASTLRQLIPAAYGWEKFRSRTPGHISLTSVGLFAKLFAIRFLFLLETLICESG